MVLDAEFVNKVRHPIERTWAAIAADVMEGRAITGDDDAEMSGADKIEVTIDANRLQLYGGPDGKAAEALIIQAVTEHDHGPVLEFLGKEIGDHME